jgi:hypothetical protein
MFIVAVFTIANYGNSQDAPQLTNGLRKCGIYTQWNFTQPQKKNEMLSFANKWMEMENIILARLRRPKNHVLPHMQIIDLKQMQ